MNADEVRDLMERLMEKAEARHAAELKAAHAERDAARAERDAEREANRKLSKAAFILKSTAEYLVGASRTYLAMKDRNEEFAGDRFGDRINEVIDELASANNELGVVVEYPDD